jgi:hypothetical protein
MFAILIEQSKTARSGRLGPSSAGDQQPELLGHALAACGSTVSPVRVPTPSVKVCAAARVSCMVSTVTAPAASAKVSAAATKNCFMMIPLSAGLHAPLHNGARQPDQRFNGAASVVASAIEESCHRRGHVC